MFRQPHTALKALTAALALAIAAPAGAQLLEELPDNLQDVGVDSRLGAQIPLDLEFRDERGEPIRLDDLFAKGRPILLTLNYSSCPRLCRVQLNGLVIALKEMEWTTGEEFTLVSVSINPHEEPEQAFWTKQKYLEEYGRDGADDGWRFLTGQDENIRELADTVGFRYKFDEKRNEYSHAASLIVCSPDGVVCRYLNGVMFDPKTIRLSLVEAGEGKIGTPVDQFLLFCFHYDETEGRYGPVARRIMALGGGATVVMMGLALLPYWLRSTPAAELEPNAEAAATTPPTGPNEEQTI